MSEKENKANGADYKGSIVILVLGLVTGFVFKEHFNVQRELGFAFVLCIPIILFAVAKGFRFGALVAIIAAAIYGSILIFGEIMGTKIGQPRLNTELINIAMMIGFGFGLGLISEMLNFRDPYRAEATIVETFVPDEETGLYNFKSFRWMLRGEMKRVKRYNRPVSLIFFKITNLDAFQRRYNYQQEVLLLKEIGHHVRGMLREADYIGKHSDNEIGVVLPETNLAGAKIVYQRMLDSHKILNKTMTKRWDEVELQFESAMANQPKHASNLEELIDVIDSRYEKIS